MNNIRWSAEEEAILAAHYPTGGAKVCATKLQRTEPAIWRRAKELGITCSVPKGGHPKPSRVVQANLEKTGGPGWYRPEWKPLHPQDFAKTLMLSSGRYVKL